MSEHSIPVMFDVVGKDRADAARHLVELLAMLELARTCVESWWLVEGRDKQHDRNDNAAGTVVFDDQCEVGCINCGNDTGPYHLCLDCLDGDR